MDQVEKRLLENIFDALDRLFDGELGAVDLFYLIYASEKALINYSTGALLSSYIPELELLVRSGATDEEQREKALEITNELRGKLNELLPI